MKRLTNARMEYKSKILVALQAYENTGYRPEEIAPKDVSPAVKQKVVKGKKKHEVELLVISTPSCRRNFYTVRMDGEEMSLNEFAEKICVGKDTVRSWVTHKIFNQRLRERGII